MPSFLSRSSLRICVLALILLPCIGILSANANANATSGEAMSSAALYMLQLAEPPASHLYASRLASGASPSQAVSAVQLHITKLTGQQNEVLTHLANRGVVPPVVSRLTRVYNGVVVSLTPRELAEVRRLAAVVAVHPMRPKQRTNSTSVPFLTVPTIWQGAAVQGAAVTGVGVRIGIIDTGIDYLHTDFAGSGLEADYASNDTTVVGDGFFPSVKVVGGWDFVGDTYDASSANPAQRIPQPDPDPMDCNGHGTHVAGTAAGFGVQAGATYQGAYDETTPFGSLTVGPGVAPQALLYALRVFGCNGDTAVVEQALEWAVDPDGNGDFSDHLDIVNLSLTSALAPLDDPAAVAADNAVLAGVVVVASAGNDGGTHFAIGSPAVASGAIAVAASWDPDPIFPARAVRIEAPVDLAGAHQAGGANFGPALVDPGVSGDAVAADPLDACVPLNNPPTAIDGKVVLVMRNDLCSYVTQVRHAQNAGTTGAIAVVIVNDRPGLEGVFNDGTGGDITIPPLMLRQRAAQRILDALPSQVTLTLTPTVLEDQFAIFSSRGPRLGDLLTKPDLAAPGVAITSARLGNSGSGGRGAMILSGTSMASPHVAGTAALLRQMHRDWTPAQIKARLINTSRDVFFDPELTPPRVGAPQMGAGRIDPLAATLGASRLSQADDPLAVSVTFGAPQVEELSQLEEVVRLENNQGDSVTYDLHVEVLSPVPGAEVTTALEEVTLTAGENIEFPLRLSLDAAQLRHTHDPSLEEGSIGFERHWLTELAGYLVATPQSGDDGALRLPFYAAPRAVSSMAASGPLALPPGPSGSSTLELMGLGLEQGDAPPIDEMSLASAYELTASRQEPMGSPFPGVASLGVQSDFSMRRGGLAETSLVFGLLAETGETDVAWSTPHEVLVSILIDTDADGMADFELSNSDEGSANFSFLTDALVSVLRDLEGGGQVIGPPLGLLSPQDRHTVPFVSDAMALAVSASSLGLGDGASRFDYAVEVTSRRSGGSLARNVARLGLPVPMPEETRSYDPAIPGLSFVHGSGDAIFPDVDGATLEVGYDLQAFDDNGSLGILLLHHHNGHGERGETVRLRADAADLALAAQSQAVVAPGQSRQIVWQIRNQGIQPAADAQLEVVLPVGMLFDSKISDPACQVASSGAESVILCTLGSMAASEARNVIFGAQVLADATPGSILPALGRVLTSSLDVVPLNDHRTVEVLVSRVVPVLEKEILGGDLLPGGSVSYRLRLHLEGLDDLADLSGPELVDTLPSSLQLLSATATAGRLEVDLENDEVRWQGPLVVGEADLVLDINAAITTPGFDATVSNQGRVAFDSLGDGQHDAEVRSNDPNLDGVDNATVFVIGGLFADGFESADTTAWSATVTGLR